MKQLNIIKLAIIGLMITTNFLAEANITQKNNKVFEINSSLSNRIKAATLISTSLMSALLYYRTIIRPYIINLAQEKGLAHAIEFNKNFVLNHPGLAALYATPLLLAIFHAILAYDYIQDKTEVIVIPLNKKTLVQENKDI